MTLESTNDIVSGPAEQESDGSRELPRSLLVTGCVKPSADGGLVQVTGGIAYDYRVALHFASRGWNVSYSHYIRDFPRPVYLTRLLVSLVMMRRYRRSSIDLIIADEGGHHHTWLFNRWARRTLGARVIVIVHHLRCRTIASPFWRALTVAAERKMLRGADLLVANSRHTISEMEGLGASGEEVLLAPPGLSVERAAGPSVSDSVRRVLLVGNVEPRKGVVDAVEALAGAGDCGDCRLVVVGKPDYDPEYGTLVRETIERLGLAGRVELAGQVGQERLEELYSRADLFLLPSRWEGYGMVIAEAMAHGLPVISTTAGAIPELVEDGSTGILVPPGDVEALTGAMSRMCADHDLRRSVARRGFEASARFPSWRQTCGLIYDAAMERLFGGGSVPGQGAGTRE